MLRKALVFRLVQKFFVEQELSQWSLVGHHFVQSRNLSSKIALTFVLFLQEVTSQVVDKLRETIKKSIVNYINQFSKKKKRQ